LLLIDEIQGFVHNSQFPLTNSARFFSMIISNNFTKPKDFEHYFEYYAQKLQ
jgi:hypothetical protein